MKKIFKLAVIGAALVIGGSKLGAQYLYQANDAPPGPVGAVPMQHGKFTNSPTVVAGKSQTNLLSRIAIRPGTGLLLAASVQGTNAASTGAQTYFFDYCVNGENGTVYTTTHPLSFTVTALGTNVVMDFTNIPPANLLNIDFIQFSGVTNNNATTNSLVTGDVRWQYTMP